MTMQQVSHLTREALQHRRDLEAEGIYLSPCFWIRNEPESTDVPATDAAKDDDDAFPIVLTVGTDTGTKCIPVWRKSSA